MNTRKNDIPRQAAILCVMVCTVFLAYCHTFQASWHLDDYRNIVNNPAVHLEDLKPASIWKTFFKTKDDAEVLYRPLAVLTLALNWYVGRDRVAGFHAFNIGVHLATTLLLYFTVLEIFKTPRINRRYRGREHEIAFAATLLWALNPVQTQAVTYIVQRMASLAALFYVFALFGYLKARANAPSNQRWGWIAASVLSYLAALASKENAIMLPVAILILEIIFYNDIKKKSGKTIGFTVIIAGFVIVTLGVLLFIVWKGDPLAYMTSRYSTRPFTMWERLMTQPRVILFYLTLIFFPLPSRLSIEHDFLVSTSLLDPWTTLPALLIVMGLICFGLFQINKQPLFAWGVLFFLINQVIESSIFPLELVFEHRNYLPSLFLFVPLAAFILNPQRHRKPHGPIKVQWHRLAIFLIIVLFGIGTFVRNQAWHSEKSLWEDALRKAPGSARVYHNLAWSHYQRMGLYQEALKRYKKALQIRGEGNPRNFSTFLNVAVIYADVGDLKRAIYFYREALNIKPGNRNARFGLCLALVKSRQFDAAQKQLEGLLARYAGEADYLNLKGFILLKTGHPQLALPIFSQSLQFDPELSDAELNMGVALGQVGRYEQARTRLHRALEKHADRRLVLLALVDNAIRSQALSRTEAYISQLVDLIPMDRVEEWIGRLKKDGRSLPLGYDLLLQKISEKVK